MLFRQANESEMVSPLVTWTEGANRAAWENTVKTPTQDATVITMMAAAGTSRARSPLIRFSLA